MRNASSNNSRTPNGSSNNKSRMRSVYSNNNRTPNGFSDSNRMLLRRPQHGRNRLLRSLSPRQPSDRNALSEGNSSLQTRTTRNPTIEKRVTRLPFQRGGFGWGARLN